MIRNIIFAWSGTLVNDLHAVWAATNHVLSQAGIAELTIERFRAEFCLPFTGFYERYTPHIAMSQLEEWFHGHFRQAQESVEPLPHAREFLEFVGHLYQLDAECVQRVTIGLLERFELREWIDELIESYSHGMRQKLALTAALIHEPEIVVIDEPMVGLDPRSARVLKTLLAELVESGRTVFLSTHTLEVAEELCSRVAIVLKGTVAAQGTLDELRLQAMAEHGSLEAVFLRLTEDREPSPAGR